MSANANPKPVEQSEDTLPPELEALRAQLGQGLHREVKEELKQEAAKPTQLRTKVYSVLGVVILAVFFIGLWLLWPARQGEPTTKTINPVAAVKRALDGPESGPWIPLNDRDGVEAKRQKMEEEATAAAYAALETARKERTEFETAVKNACKNDDGRHVAMSGELVARFRVVVDDAELKAAAEFLDMPPKTAVPDKKRADDAAGRYRRAQILLKALLAHAASTQPKASMTLGDALARQQEREALRALELRTKLEAEARDAAEKKAAEDAAQRVAAQAEEKRWGVVKPGAVWEGTQNDRGRESPVQVMITSRKNDAIEGTITWTYSGSKQGLAFVGTCDGDRLTWKTTKRSVGYEGKPGSVHTARVSGTSLTTSYVYPLEGSEVVGTITAKLKVQK